MGLYFYSSFGLLGKAFGKWMVVLVLALPLLWHLSNACVVSKNRLCGRISSRSTLTKLCLVSVDGTDFKIQEPYPFFKGWYSHKFKPAVYYEVAICIAKGNIVWINGPYPEGLFSDLCIFCFLLKWLLFPWEMVKVDLGYRGELFHCSTKEHCRDDIQCKEKSTVWTHHETVN